MEPQLSKPFTPTPNIPDLASGVPNQAPTPTHISAPNPTLIPNHNLDANPTSPNQPQKQPTSSKNLYFLIGGIVLLLIIVVVIVGIVIFNSAQSSSNPPATPNSTEQTTESKTIPSSFDFAIVDDSVPGGSTTVSVEGNQVTVDEYSACSAVDCKGSSDVVEYQFSDENIAKLYEFYENELAELVSESSGSDEDAIFESDLDYYQLGVINALSLGEDQFAHDVQPLRYRLYIDVPVDLYNSDMYQLKVPEDGLPYVVKTTYNNGVNYDYYDLDFDDQSIEAIDELIDDITADSSKRDRFPTYGIDYDEATPEQKVILDAIIKNDDSKI